MTKDSMFEDRIEGLRGLSFLDKICGLKSYGMGLDDGMFHGVFSPLEEDVLLALEVLGMVDTGVIRLLR